MIEIAFNMSHHHSRCRHHRRRFDRLHRYNQNVITPISQQVQTDLTA